MLSYLIYPNMRMSIINRINRHHTTQVPNTLYRQYTTEIDQVHFR